MIFNTTIHVTVDEQEFWAECSCGWTRRFGSRPAAITNTEIHLIEYHQFKVRGLDDVVETRHDPPIEMKLKERPAP